MNEIFKLRISERCENYGDGPGSLPDEELDVCIWRFCHDQNRNFVIQFGAETIDKVLDLDSDFSIMWDEFLCCVDALAAGKPEDLAFGERCYNIFFVPQGELVQCTVDWWGYKSHRDDQTFLCERKQVLEELKNFLVWVADNAIAGGYLSADRREEFLWPDVFREP